MSLFSELKRRNVFRVSAAYIALGWIVTDVTSTVAPILHLPDWVDPLVLWLGIIGFPFVVMFSWIYELTPEGLKRESEVDRTQSITHVTGRRLDWVVIALLVVAIGLAAYQQFRPSPPQKVTVVARPAAPEQTQSATDRSVAVLPFVDMSPGKDQEYFADGISEELLNLLAQVPGLRVIARTSSFSFKGKEADIAEIAHKLNVANVLEGSVRTAGDKVRITAQLIRASDSSHVWSQTYDREMTDVFKVQDEIASAVVGQLKVTLLGAAPTVHATDPKAYALFLRGREVGRQYNAAAFEQALGLLREALAIDPTYAPAWTQISMVHVGQIDLGLLAPANGIAESHEVLKQAIAHDPAYAPAYAQLALIEGVLERNYAQAAQDLGRALTLDPTNSDIIGAASIFARRLGRMALAITLAQRQVAQDPVNPDGFDSLALAYRYNGQLDKCLEAYRTVLSLTPDTGWTHAAIGSVLLEQGRPEAALAEFQKEPVEEYRLSGSSAAYYLMGRRPEADAMLAELLQKFGDTRPYIIAMVLATRGDKDRAFAMLEKSGELNELDLGAIPVVSAFDTLHDDPRWLPLLRKLGLAPEQLDSIKFDVTVPQ